MNKQLQLITIPIIFVLFFSACKKSHSPVTGVYFPYDTLNLGAIKAGEEKEFSIPIVNNSDTMIRVLQFSNSCRCLLLNEKTLNLPGNTTYTLKAKVQSRLSDKGLMVKAIALRTNEPRPIKVISIVATII